MTEEQKALQLVEDLNGEIYTIYPDEVTHGTIPSFEFSSNGVSYYISFNGCCLWDSDNDERPWDESGNEQEDLRRYIIRKAYTMAREVAMAAHVFEKI